MLIEGGDFQVGERVGSVVFQGYVKGCPQKVMSSHCWPSAALGAQLEDLQMI